MMKSVLIAFSLAALFAAAGSLACGPDGKQANSATAHDSTAAAVAKTDAAPVAKTQPSCSGGDCATTTTAPPCDGANCNVAKPAVAVPANTKGKVATVSTH
jgi:hypothetical protein